MINIEINQKNILIFNSGEAMHYIFNLYSKDVHQEKDLNR